MNRIQHVVAGIAAIFFVTPDSSAGADSDWTMYRGNAGHTSYVDVSLNAATFGPAWSVPLTFPQWGTGSWSEHGVTTDGTRVFVTSLEGYAPSGNYHVMALNVANGAEAWRQTIPSGAFEGVSSPSCMNGTVYVNRAGHSSSSGSDVGYPKLIGIDNVTGAIKWQTKYSAQWGENFRPIPTGNQVFAAGGYYGGFYGYNAATGAQQWFNSNAPWGPSNANVAVDEQYVYIFGTRYSRSTGAAAGSFALPSGGNLYNPVVAGDQIYFATASAGNGLVAFDRATMQRLWEIPTGFDFRSAAIGEQIIALSVAEKLTLLDRQTGSTIRTWTGQGFPITDLILTESHAFVTDAAGVYAINLATGQTAWSAPVTGELALSNNMLLVSNADHVTAFHLPEPASAAVLLTFTVLRRARRRA